jgi:predicted nucleotidyltransferase
MIPILDENRDAIAALCMRYGVGRLEVFGSAAEGGFSPEQSDIDLLVEFGPGEDLGAWMSRYFELQEALEALLGRSVGLVMLNAPALQNPYFAREANRTRRLLYAAQGPQVAG